MPRKNRLVPHRFYRPTDHCQGKRSFKTQQLAQQAIVHQELIQPFDQLELATYKCPTCQGWHLTSKKPVEPDNCRLG